MTVQENAAPAGVVDIFTDGACSGNPGPGGWGAVLRYGGHEKELSGFDPATTAGPFETAFQDVIGFGVFLWLASMLLPLLR